MAGKAKTGSGFNQDQYEILRRCSKIENWGEWDDWRKQHPKEAIRLKGADFQNVDLWFVNLEGAELWGANLKGAMLCDANLKGAKFRKANLKGARLEGANLEEANLDETKLQRAKLRSANLKHALLRKTNLQGADLEETRLQGADFRGANLRSARFNLAQVDGMTTIVECSFNENTYFTGVGLDAAIINPGLKAALKDNIRRMHWQRWLDVEREKDRWSVPWLWPWPVEWFWKVTDFGSSTKRIIKTFFKLAIAFAGLYWFVALPTLLCPQWRGIIEGLWQGEGWIGVVQTFFRAVYFSIVTMTTLGFGDMHAAESGFFASLFGNIFLSIQVLLGYVLLGALITRLGILFTSEAPAAELSPDRTKEKNDD